MEETRNVIDHYWYWPTEAIKADLDQKRHPFAVLSCNLYNDYNIGGVIRNANAFLASKIFIYGSKRWDRRGAVGTHHYQHLEHLPLEYDLTELKRDYVLVGMDNVDEAIPIDEFEWPENSLMIFGQEQLGVPQEVLDQCDHKVYIRQFGSVRSLNVACASAIAMYDYCSKYKRI